MSHKQIRFVYQTGLKRQILRNPRLVGSWNAEGRFDPDTWTSVDMKEESGDDGCPTFTATIHLQPESAGTVFEWGVLIDGPGGPDQWGIMTEANVPDSQQRVRQFRLDAADAEPLEQVYHLNYSRRLGANKLYTGVDGPEAIRFGVWAPNATRVETVVGCTWRDGDPERRPLEGLPADRRSIAPTRILGGYIADDGQGIHPELGPFPMVRHPDDVWLTDPNDLRLRRFSELDHIPYMFRVTKDDGQVAYRTDIFSRCQIGAGAKQPGAGAYTGRLVDLDGAKSCSAVIDPDSITAEFEEEVYPERSWIKEADFWAEEFDPARPMPKTLDELVIYELHLGALGFGRPDPGTIGDALELLDYVEELGANAVELLPMAEFGGGNENWGYATSHYFAIEYGGGGRDKFKFFVRECHRRGIAVIMDVVYNHYTHDAERAQWMYDTNDHARNPYYWYEGHPEDYASFNQAVPSERRGTGGYLDNLSTGWAPRYHREIIRKMFSSMALALMEEFHIDGFRVDQTTSIHGYNVLHADGRPVGNANVYGAKTLREWSRTQKLVRPNVFLIAEDHSGWDAVTKSADEGGLGFDAVWYADFYHHLVGDGEGHEGHAKLLKNAGYGDDRPLAMDRFAAAMEATGQGKVVYSESHDEAGNGSGTARNILIAVNHAPLVGETRRYAEARCRFVFGVTVFSAGLPMFLFGEEVGSDQPLLYDKVLEHKEDLEGMRNGVGRGLFEFHRDAIAWRRASQGLRSRHIEIVHVHNANRVIAFRRWDGDQEFLVIGSLNNAPFREGYELRNDRIGGKRWREVFNSDATTYGGHGVGNGGALIQAESGRIAVVVPANAVLVLRKE